VEKLTANLPYGEGQCSIQSYCTVKLNAGSLALHSQRDPINQILLLPVNFTANATACFNGKSSSSIFKVRYSACVWAISASIASPVLGLESIKTNLPR
jgi:hypothetical protein